MRDVIEHMGIGLLEILGCVCIIKIVMTFVAENGVLYEIVANYMKTLCG